MDFDNLANILVKRDSIDWQLTGNAIFLILNDKRLSEESRNSLVVEILKRAINFNRFDIALKLWKIYAIIITSNPKTVIPVLVESF